MQSEGILPQSKFGQNFLCDEDIIQRIVDLCEIMNLINCVSLVHSLRDNKHTLVGWFLKSSINIFPAI